MHSFRPVVVLFAIVLMGAACGGSDDTSVTTSTAPSTAPAEAALPGVISIEVGSAIHVETVVDYPTHPPAGGDHFLGWANCGFYTVELPEVTAVHSLEHGAVWYTYRDDLPQADIDALKALSDANDRVLVSPYANQSSPLVATAWGFQLPLDGFGPEVAAFADLYIDATTAPEFGVACNEALGIPPDNVDTLPDGSVIVLPS